MNVDESNETISSATSTPSSKLPTRHDEATLEAIETQTASTEIQNDSQTASTEIQNDSSLSMDLSLEEREESVEERNKHTHVMEKYENKLENEPCQEFNLKV